MNDMGAGKTLEWWDAWLTKMKADHGNGNGHGASLAIELKRSWEDYSTALATWGDVLGRPHPQPLTPDGETSPEFVEWLMGVPAGHVTDVGISPTEQLKALGNGVVPQQAAAATRWWLAQLRAMKEVA